MPKFCSPRSARRSKAGQTGGGAGECRPKREALQTEFVVRSIFPKPLDHSFGMVINVISGYGKLRGSIANLFLGTEQHVKVGPLGIGFD